MKDTIFMSATTRRQKKYIHETADVSDGTVKNEKEGKSDDSDTSTSLRRYLFAADRQKLNYTA